MFPTTQETEYYFRHKNNKYQSNIDPDTLTQSQSQSKIGHGHEVSEKVKRSLSHKADRNVILAAKVLDRQSASLLLYHLWHLYSHLNAQGKSNEQINDEYKVKWSSS